MLSEGAPRLPLPHARPPPPIPTLRKGFVKRVSEIFELADLVGDRSVERGETEAFFAVGPAFAGMFASKRPRYSHSACS
jgi:hypothetical protein